MEITTSANRHSIEDLMIRSLEQISAGLCSSGQMRERISKEDNLASSDKLWPRFVNNHAWALVRLQTDRRIQKTTSGEYSITSFGRAAIVKGIVVRALPIEAVQLSGPLPSWAESVRRTKNGINRKRWPDMACALAPSDIRALWVDCEGRCSVTGLPFTGDQYGEGAARRAFAPSLDRIDPGKPYCRDNCRFVLVAVNFALNAFGDEIFDRLVMARRERIPKATAKRLASS